MTLYYHHTCCCFLILQDLLWSDLWYQYGLNHHQCHCSPLLYMCLTQRFSVLMPVVQGVFFNFDSHRWSSSLLIWHIVENRCMLMLFDQCGLFTFSPAHGHSSFTLNQQSSISLLCVRYNWLQWVWLCWWCIEKMICSHFVKWRLALSETTKWSSLHWIWTVRREWGPLKLEWLGVGT